MLVGAFITNNTFSVTVAQRTREMAMLRAIGASGRQVKRSVLVEAAVIGTVASGAGLAAGIGVAAGLRRLMSAFGFDMPDGPTIIEPKAMILSFAVGVIVTVLSSWLPARRTARIAPVAALRDVGLDRSSRSIRRAVIGSVPTAAGVAALLPGLGGAAEGDLDALGADGIAVSAEHAGEQGWTMGSTVPATFPSGDATFVVEAIYSTGTDWVGSTFVDLEALRANGGDELDFRVYVTGDEAAIAGVAAGYASAEVLDKDAFLDVVSTEIDTMLGMFYALLLLAIVIALLGIANTLALSIFERIRELGLLRAVGMNRSQVRSMVRWESIIIAVFGTTLGLAVGTFFGWAIVQALAAEGIDTLTVPFDALAVVTVIAALAGAMAAVMPARRAAKLDVLQALGTE